MIAEIPEQALTLFKTAAPDLRTRELYAGQFDAEQLKRKAYSSPGVFVTCLGWKPARDMQFGNNDHDVRLAAFVVSRNSGGIIQAMRECTVIGEQITRVLYDWQPDLPKVSPGRPERAENTFTLKSLETGQLIWPIYWWHTVGLQAELSEQDLGLQDWLQVCVASDEQRTPGSTDIEVEADLNS